MTYFQYFVNEVSTKQSHLMYLFSLELNSIKLIQTQILKHLIQYFCSPSRIQLTHLSLKDFKSIIKECLNDGQNQQNTIYPRHLSNLNQIQGYTIQEITTFCLLVYSAEFYKNCWLKCQTNLGEDVILMNLINSKGNIGGTIKIIKGESIEGFYPNYKNLHIDFVKKIIKAIHSQNFLKDFTKGCKYEYHYESSTFKDIHQE